MKKFAKKVLLPFVSLLLAFLLLWCAVVWVYYPHYTKNKREILTDATFNTEEIKIMSYNIRCHAPDDLGHKNWFYRANLVVDTIEKAAPTIIGFQEVNSSQYDYLCETMPSYDSIITFRDNIPLYSLLYKSKNLLQDNIAYHTADGVLYHCFSQRNLRLRV